MLPIIGFGRRLVAGTPGVGGVSKVWSTWRIWRCVGPLAADSPETRAGDPEARDRRQGKPESSTFFGKEGAPVEAGSSSG